MLLTKSQNNVLKLLAKNNGNLLYTELHANKAFKSDYEVQSSVESLIKIGFIECNVYACNQKAFTSKSDDTDELIKERLRQVKYLNPNNRLFITLEGIAYLQETKNACFRYWIPIIFTTALSFTQVVVSVLPYIIPVLLQLLLPKMLCKLAIRILCKKFLLKYLLFQFLRTCILHQVL